jgi:hypothetical protein
MQTNNIIKGIFFIIFMFLLIMPGSTVYSQGDIRGYCGTDIADQLEMEAKYAGRPVEADLTHRNNTIYIPVKFHLVANSDGVGRIAPQQVLKQLCVLNRDFSTANMKFYIDGNFNYIDNTAIYSSPGSNANAIQGRKFSKALNIFITDKADVDGSLGTTLGYYSPQGDFVVVIKSEVVKTTNTLSHEVGHFFSLRHTFFGWEREPWSEAKYTKNVSIKYTLDGVEVEYVNGTNCQTAADQLCDTPPDYNFGFTSNGCNFAYEVYDPNGDKITPMKDNQMSYFSGCPTFKFTENQFSRIKTNYQTSARSFLRTGYIPKTDTITGPVSFIYPAPNQQLNIYDKILLDWADVENATGYILELRSGFGEIQNYVVNGSEFTVTNLRKNFNYSWTVIPFNETQTCFSGNSANFKTGNQLSTATENIDYIDHLQIYPNPVTLQGTTQIQVSLKKSTACELTISDLSGKAIYTTTTSLKEGNQLINIDLIYPSSGMYILHLSAEHFKATRKIVVAE